MEEEEEEEQAEELLSFICCRSSTLQTFCSGCFKTIKTFQIKSNSASLQVNVTKTQNMEKQSLSGRVLLCVGGV